MHKLETPEYDWNFKEDRERLNFLVQKRVNWRLGEQWLEELKKLNNKVFDHTWLFSKQLISIFSDPLGSRVGNWQDNIVYDYRKNRVVKVLNFKKYKTNENMLEYYRKKYKILKKVLWDHIPDTYFLEWEVSNHIPCHYNNLLEYEPKYNTIYTAQRKVKWYTLRDLPVDIKHRKDFLEQLNEIYNLYIRLKLYIHFLEFKHFSKVGVLNFRMDIWDISKRLDVLDENLIWYKSQNIMYDLEKNKIFLIDFDTGSYNQDIKKVFNELEHTDKEDIIERWDTILWNIKNKETKLTNWKLNRFFRANEFRFL